MPVASVFTSKRHGDLAVGGPPGPLIGRRSAIVAEPWTWLHQVHGARVIAVTEPGAQAGAEADAVVTATPGAPIAVHAADCAPLLLVSDGAVGVVHAGWRGLLAGVVEAAADALVALGHPPRRAVLGPTIRPRCYEFGPADLELLVERYGAAVASTTSWGAPALDLAASVRAATAALDLALEDDGTCTACSPAHWSHRGRGDAGRQALVAWVLP